MHRIIKNIGAIPSLLTVVLFLSIFSGAARADVSVEARADLEQSSQAIEAGDLAAARRYAGMAMSTARIAGDRPAEASASAKLSAIFAREEKWSEAAKSEEDALRIYRDARDEESEMLSLFRLGRYRFAAGDSTVAVGDVRLAAGLAKKLGRVEWEAGALELLGTILYFRMDLNGALSTFDDCARLYRTLGKTEKVSEISARIYPLYVRTGRLEEALGSLQRTVSAARASSDLNLRGGSCADLADLYVRSDRVDSAILAYKESLESWKKLGRWDEFGRVMLRLGHLYASHGREDNALVVFENAHDAARLARDDATRARSLTAWARLASERGREAEALVAVDSALALLGATRDQSASLVAASIRAAILQKLGRREEAYKEYEQARVLAKRAGDATAEGSALHGQGEVLYALKNHEEARAAFESALRIRRRLDEPAALAATLHNLALCEKALGQDSEAERHREEAGNLQTGKGDPLADGARKMDEGGRLRGEGRLDDAHASFRAAALLFSQARARGPEGRAKYNIGLIEALSGNPVEARTHLNEAYFIATSAGDADLASQALLLIARLDRAIGETDAAAAHYREALTVLDGLRASAPPGEARQIFFENHMRAFGEMVDLSAASDRAADAMFYLESMRGRRMIEMVADREDELWAGVDTELRSGRDALQSELTALHKSLMDALKNGGASAEVEKQLGTKKEEYTRFIERARRLAPTVASIRYPAPMHGDSICRALGAGEAILEYWTSGEKPGVFVATPQRCRFVSLPATAREIDDLTRAYLEPWHGDRAYNKSGGYSGHLDIGARLREILIDPVRELLADATRWIVLPDRMLRVLPFEALVTDTEYKRFLIDEEITITYAPSATVAMTLASQSAPTSSGVLALADPDLRGFTGDVRPITTQVQLARQKFTWKEFAETARLTEGLEVYREMGHHAVAAAGHLDSAMVATRGEATEEFFKRNASRYRHIIFNTHGFLDDQSPLYSALLLKLPRSGESTEDGLLYAYELFSAHMDADEVWIGACESSLGAERPGEGMAGMATAFLAAGARSTIGSVWSVDVRSSGRLLEEYFRLRASGVESAEALAQAKRAVRQKYPDPFDWAAFVRIGR